MQLVTISPSRHPPKVWLKFSDDSLIPFKLDDVVSLGLKKFTELDQGILNKIYNLSLKFILLEYALRQVAISPKTKQILLPKLRQKLLYLSQKYHYPSGDYHPLLDEIITYLDINQLLNSDDFKTHFIKKSKNKSRAEISYLLKSKGVIFLPADLPNDLPKIKILLQKKLKSTNLSDQKSKNKLISALVRKGFALNDVKKAIDDLMII